MSADLRSRQTAMVMIERSVNLTTLLLARLRPPRRLTSTMCPHFRKELPTVLLESVEREVGMGWGGARE